MTECAATNEKIVLIIGDLGYSVIEDLVSGNIRPELLLIEFHHGMYEGVTADNTIQSVMLLVEAGYAIFYVSDSGQEYGLLKI